MFRHITGKLLLLGAAVAWLGLGVSCVSPQEVIYLQDVQGTTTESLKNTYQTTIQKDDQLAISVSSKQPELTAPFNMSEMSASGRSSGSNNSQGYLVDANGNIVLPIIGRIHAAGKTCTQLATDIANTLRDSGYLNDASVNVQIRNFKFSVIGEVSNPGVYTIDGQRITILEAISKAGDLTIDGNRAIQVVREVDGNRQIATLDLRSKELFNSPFYYIQQNDVIYVTPSDRKVNTRSDAAQWYGWGLSGVGVTLAIIALCAS